MANTSYTITDFAMYLVKTGRAKDATTAGKRVRSALRANKAAMSKVDVNVKKHQKGASYLPLNAASAKVLANALNITNVASIKRNATPKRKNKAPKNVKAPATVASSDS